MEKLTSRSFTFSNSKSDADKVDFVNDAPRMDRFLRSFEKHINFGPLLSPRQAVISVTRVDLSLTNQIAVRPATDSVLDVSVQVGRVAEHRLGFTIFSSVDLSTEAALEVVSGFGKKRRDQTTDTFKIGPMKLILRILEFASFDGNLLEFDFKAKSVQEHIIHDSEIQNHSGKKR